MRGIFLGVAVALCAPATALGAQASVGGYLGSGAFEVNYRADGGEANKVTVSLPTATTMRINDPGALLVNGLTLPRIGACTTELFGTTCTPSIALLHLLLPGLDNSVPYIARFNLGDRNDRAVINGPSQIQAEGGTGDDEIISGADGTMEGGPGNDKLTALKSAIMSGGLGADVFTGNDLADARQLVYYYDRKVGMSITLDDLANDGEPGEGDNVRANIDLVSGGSGPDVIIGNDARQELIGGEAADYLAGLGGNDDIHGSGFDQIDGGEGDDWIVLNYGGPGGLTLGGNGDDEISARASAATIDAGAGDDLIHARSATDDQPANITCGPGTDTVFADATDTVAPDCENVTIS